jgi:alginate O-acetyltransferase complex protein AlgI
VLFTEPTFLFLFLPVLLALYFLTRVHAGYANLLLLAASVLFYAKGGGAFTWLMLGSIAFNYVMAILVDRARATSDVRARQVLAAAVTVNLLVLAWFKYANFLVENANAMLGAVGARSFAAPEVLLPIGISFYTFHAISYVVDVYRRQAAAQKSPVHAGLYMLLFPQLIAGPIIRYREIADQLARRTVALDDFACGVRRFIIGLGKKVLIANVLAGPADGIFQMPAHQLIAPYAWLGIVCYTLQIYFDFSGYSDMAIGLGRMFGFRFPENFRWPYVADSVQEFWRRWHISLSSWFRDYVYVPLGGNRVAPALVYRNLVIVFFLCGLWHGASWNFVIWGLYHGAFLVLERLGLARLLRRASPAARHLYLLVVVMVGWVFFRADTLPQALTYLQALAGAGGTEMPPVRLSWYLNPEVRIALVAGIVGATPVVPALAALSRDRLGAWRAQALEAAGAVALVGMFLAALLQVGARSYNPFIYFRF